MAQRLVQLNRWSGPAALGCAAGLILLAAFAVVWTGGLGPLGPGDVAAIRFTLIQAILSATCSVVLAIPVARALARRQFIGRGVLVALLGAPFILPVIVAIFGLLAVFGRTGLLSQGLDVLGLPSLSIYGLHGVVLAHVFFNLPLATRLLLQGWADVPTERFRLAAQLGCDGRQIFRLIEWPILRRLVPGAFMLIFAICLTSFSVALTLGGGPRATTIELAIYQAFRFDFDLGRAAFLSVLQLVIAGSAALLALSFIPPNVAERGLHRPLQRWDAPPLWPDVLWIGLAAAFLLVPLATVVASGLRGFDQMPASVFQSVGRSLWVALVSVATMLVMALPIAGWLASRTQGRIEAFGLLGLAASPLMIGTGWFILINPYANPQDLALLVTALVNALTMLPFALRIMIPGIRAAIEDHGRLGSSLGLSNLQLWRWAIWPRLCAPLGFAAGLGAAMSVGDLGVITLFADPDRATLPLQMYRLMGSFQVEAAAGAALVLLCLSFGLFAAFDQLGRRLARA